jgi:hypothetical protein
VEIKGGRFKLTPLAATLRTDVHASLRAWALQVNGQRHLEFAVRRYSLAADVTLHYEYKLEAGAAWQAYTGEIVDVGTEALPECQSEHAIKRCAIPANASQFYLGYYLTRP